MHERKMKLCNEINMIEVKSKTGTDFYKTLFWRVEVVSHQHFEGNYLLLSVPIIPGWGKELLFPTAVLKVLWEG